MLADALELAERAYGTRASGYAREIHERLTLGAERYGDTNYLDKDNLIEAGEELPDFAAYLLLELQRLQGQLRDEDLDELRMYAIGAIAAASHVHELLRRLSRYREEFLTSR